MVFDPQLAEIRFGSGLSPTLAPVTSTDVMLARLQGPDRAADHFPIAKTDEILALVRVFAKLRKLNRSKRTTPEAKLAEKAFKRFRREYLQQRDLWFRQLLLRHVTTQDGFRERLTLFWADHFTAKGKNRAMRPLAYGYVESAIRPNITGRFEDLLIAALTNPLMLHYLDQFRSRGENSALSRRQGGRGGLNENLAREVLELHTLGVDGPYGQKDVRQLAELFTGLSYGVEKGFVFDQRMAEPGAETVLGRVYGGAEPALAPVLQVLRDLARHPATAAHIAQKLAVHFTQDQPDPDLVADLTSAYRDSGGDLLEVYTALLSHATSWQPELRNVKPPFDFLASACRGLGVAPALLAGWEPKQIRRGFIAPLKLMGQDWQSPVGPDGWAEADAAWITPQGLSARLRWAMAAPQRLVEPLPDPLGFAQQCLGARANPGVQFVASAAETRGEALGLVLCSPAFQRR
ncbi:DUF1800 domain-containing protein [Pseudophaeobacter arcticus]|jgi:uncharacterized protein (DUF1800 family)|uniref:DUF1800 domain-containing protein n=1 Tax=Pseudophaeobacter arcticus TaxID=385492 RepID=UPI0039E5F316